jgi:hypothetical protein
MTGCVNKAAACCGKHTNIYSFGLYVVFLFIAACFNTGSAVITTVNVLFVLSSLGTRVGRDSQEFIKSYLNPD